MRQVEWIDPGFLAELAEGLTRDASLWWDGVLVGMGILAAAGVLVAAVWACVRFL